MCAGSFYERSRDVRSSKNVRVLIFVTIKTQPPKWEGGQPHLGGGYEKLL